MKPCELRAPVTAGPPTFPAVQAGPPASATRSSQVYTLVFNFRIILFFRLML